MKLKSYFSGTVEAAMELARKEMGEEALLVHVRPTTPETRVFGAFEVVFGIPPADPRAGAPSVSAALAAQRPGEEEREEPPHRGNRHVAAGARSPAVPGGDSPSTRPPVQPLGQPDAGGRRATAELEPERERPREEDAALEDLFAVDATLGRRGGARGVVALVGPPGAGKTTTLVKLAVRYGLAARRPVHIVSADVYRVAAARQLESLAAIAGIVCTIADSPAVLRKAVEGLPARELLLIDTPGLGPGDLGECAGLMRLIGSHPEMDVHLVLPATLQPAILRHAIDRYEPFRPQKLLFTHLDECSDFEALISQSARCSLPISFLSTGQCIPDDLEPATRRRLCTRAPAGPRETGTGAAA